MLGLKSEDRLWIGVNDIVQEGIWVWEDGTTDPVVNWAPSEPNNHSSNEDCAYIYVNSMLNDSPCSTNQGVLCETERMDL